MVRFVSTHPYWPWRSAGKPGRREVSGSWAAGREVNCLVIVLRDVFIVGWCDPVSKTGNPI